MRRNKRIKLLERENEVLCRAGRLPLAGSPPGNMMYPLVRELAVDGIPVTVTCRVLEMARHPCYRWLAGPVIGAELSAADRCTVQPPDSR